MKNSTIFQFFHWYFPADAALWKSAPGQADFIHSLGFDYIWFPPAYKSAYGASEPGYAVYDLFDLGEFDQKGSLPTKYGTKDDYLNCLQEFHNKGIKVVADIVLNHRLGADEEETVAVRKVNPENRNEFISETHNIEAYTRFTFPGRNKMYSDFIWDYHCFSGIDGEINNEKVIYSVQNEYGEGWEPLMEAEKGNFDYLMGADTEFRNPAVREELIKWGKWYIETTGIDALRLDAVKHINPQFYIEWLDILRGHFKKDIFCIAEYWSKKAEVLLEYGELMGGRLQLFDVPLHYNFHRASIEGEAYDMRQIFDNTLTAIKPEWSITFVENHDTQPLQALESVVDHWFKPHAYAIILLREQGIPCVFFPCVYGAKYDNPDNKGNSVEMLPVDGIEILLKVRKHFAYGLQRDYFDHNNVVGWTREGTEDNPSGCVVLISNGNGGEKQMDTGKTNAYAVFVDVTGNSDGEVKTDENGLGLFYTDAGSISVWIKRDMLEKLSE